MWVRFICFIVNDLNKVIKIVSLDINIRWCFLFKFGSLRFVIVLNCIDCFLMVYNLLSVKSLFWFCVIMIFWIVCIVLDVLFVIC